MILESKNPMKAMNRPMPAPIASFSDLGMASMTISRRFVSTRIVMMNTFENDDAHRLLPGQAHPEDQAVGDHRVKPHARRQRERVLGVETHGDRRDRSREASADEDQIEVQACRPAPP